MTDELFQSVLEARDLDEYQRTVVRFHMPEGLHFVLGVDRDQALPGDRAEVGRMLAALQLFASMPRTCCFRR